MKICFMSDLHGKYKQIDQDKIKGHILIVCGDSFAQGISEKELIDFNIWLGKTKPRHRILIWGNHDTIAERHPAYAKSLITNAIVLCDEGVEIDGVKIWGTPYSPQFGRWSFMRDDRDNDLGRHFGLIPDNIDILVTHSPPFGILDENVYGDKCGSIMLLNKIIKNPPKINAFGHIHEAHGQYSNNNTQFINCSLLNEHYLLVRYPVIIDFKKNKVDDSDKS